MAAGLDDIAASLLRRLPPDGTPIPNRAARALVTQDLGELVSVDDYFSARDKLLSQRKVGRVRGQGGSVFLLPPPPRASSVPPPESAGPLSERALMSPLGEALKGPFRQWLDLPQQGVVEFVDIAQTRTRGQWSNPDYLMVSVCPLTVLSGAQIDVHVFELKNEAGGKIASCSRSAGAWTVRTLRASRLVRSQGLAARARDRTDRHALPFARCRVDKAPR